MMDYVKEFDTDVLDLKIYFKKHEERSHLLYLSSQEYEILYMRSHFLCTSEDFKARRCEQQPASQVYQRTHPTDVSSSLPAIQCQVAIQTPELFAMDASDVACFLLICSQTDVDFKLLSRFHLIAMLMVTDYYQMDTIAFLLFRHYVKMTNVLQDPLTECPFTHFWPGSSLLRPAHKAHGSSLGHTTIQDHRPYASQG